MKSFFTDKSSRVNSVSFDEERSELPIEFTRGGKYMYYGVLEDVYIALLHAESIGKAINDLVKGKYSYIKL